MLSSIYIEESKKQAGKQRKTPEIYSQSDSVSDNKGYPTEYKCNEKLKYLLLCKDFF